MPILSTPNRAPDFNAAFTNEEEFEFQRDPTAMAGLASQAAPEERALERLQQLYIGRKVGGGFSIRELGPQIAEESGSRIVSEHEGMIDTLLISVPRDRAAINPLDARHYAALLAGLGPWVKYVIVCDPRQEQALRNIAATAGVPPANLAFVLSPRFNYSIWAQDAYVALNSRAGSMILCEGVSFPRAEDMTIADDVAAQSNVAMLQSYLYFQGGNVLGSSERTLIGMDYVLRNTSRFGLSDVQAVVEKFERQFGTRVLALGGNRSGEYGWYQRGILSGHGNQPIFHIDMYVTPTGIRAASGKEIVFLGRPQAAKDVLGHYSDVAELDTPKYNSFFDETEEALAREFEVRYLPLWITSGNLNVPQLSERYYNLTFNNCIVQNDGQKKLVLLPSYSEDADDYGVDGDSRRALEAAAKAQWESIGFEVSWMDGVEDLAYNAGAVHCITKALRRR